MNVNIKEFCAENFSNQNIDATIPGNNIVVIGDPFGKPKLAEYNELNSSLINARGYPTFDTT